MAHRELILEQDIADLGYETTHALKLNGKRDAALGKGKLDPQEIPRGNWGITFLWFRDAAQDSEQLAETIKMN